MATTWTLDTISFNSGADVNGVQWWADPPTGWNTLTSTGQVIDRVTANGSIIAGARLAHRSLLVKRAEVLAPSSSTRWAAQTALEALVETMITTAVTLTVAEPAGNKSLSVRYVNGFDVRILTAASFEFTLPLLALSPTKT